MLFAGGDRARLTFKRAEAPLSGLSWPRFGRTQGRLGPARQSRCTAGAWFGGVLSLARYRFCFCFGAGRNPFISFALPAAHVLHLRLLALACTCLHLLSLALTCTCAYTEYICCASAWIHHILAHELSIYLTSYSGGSVSRQIGHCSLTRIHPSRHSLWNICRHGVTI